MKNSIRKRLALIFIGLAIGPLILIGGIIAWQSFSVQQQQALNLQHEMAQRVAVQVAVFFEKLEIELGTVSQVQGLLKLNPDQQRSLLAKLLSYQNVFEALVWLDNRGQEQLYLTHRSLTPPELRNRAGADEFVIPQTTGQVYYSPARFDETTGEPFITIAVPLLNLRTGGVDGVLIAETRLKRIWDLIAGIQGSPGQSVYMVDTQGDVMAHRNPSVVLQGSHFDVPALAAGLQRGVTGSWSVLAVETIHVGQQTFYIIVEQTAVEALALGITTVLITMFLVVAMLMISGSLGWLIVRQIVRPIELMAITARSISAGDLSQQVLVTRSDELGILGEAFNDMTRRLRTFINDLEQQVAERHRAEEKIHRLNEELEQRVIERTTQLENANKELEAFSYSVSHDLRSPLRAIDGYTRILLEDYEVLLDIEGKRVCTVIRSETRRMSQLIDDLLAFSRLSRSQMQTVSIDMAQLAALVFAELVPPAEQNRIDFRVEPLPPAQGDPAMIHQVWLNLLANAVKFSAKREQAIIQVGSRQAEREIIYYVRDNGAGFEMQYADKLFGVFQRLHSEQEFPGTGVGLAIVQRIIHRHGGRVWAQGQVDQGATFYFTLL